MPTPPPYGTVPPGAETACRVICTAVAIDPDTHWRDLWTKARDYADKVAFAQAERTLGPRWTR